MKLIRILTTTPSTEVAQSISDQLIKLKLVACAQISQPITSVYSWQGEICHDTEYQVCLKTTSELYSAVETKIKALHPYDVPQIIATEIIHSSDEYQKWIVDTVSK